MPRGPLTRRHPSAFASQRALLRWIRRVKPADDENQRGWSAPSIASPRPYIRRPAVRGCARCRRSDAREGEEQERGPARVRRLAEPALLATRARKPLADVAGPRSVSSYIHARQRRPEEPSAPSALTVDAGFAELAAQRLG